MKTLLFFMVMATSWLLSPCASGQSPVLRGMVQYRNEANGQVHVESLVGAHIIWQGTNIGVVSDHNGRFEIPKPPVFPNNLIVSFTGFVSDTVFVSSSDADLTIILEETQQLEEFEVQGRRPGAHFRTLEPILTQAITTEELQRAACCNLSEAFETNAAIDVTFSDAVTGAKQIQLLGLAGIYSQILTENMPSIRGLFQPFGLMFLPGPWMESIQVSKGTASVVNGFESITGQINVELKKPETAETLFYNFYANDNGRLESTINAAVSLNQNWHTMILAHGEILNNRFDHNHDTFLDHPTVRRYNIINRYRFDRPGIMESQFGVRVVQEERQGGQMAFFENGESWGSANYYGFGVNTGRFEAFAKTGFFFRNLPNASLGTQFSFSYHDHASHYGRRSFDGTQNTFYGNIIFDNTIAGSLNHRITTGISFLFDDYDEVFADSLFARRELVPGIFGQYTFNIDTRFTLIAGLRADHHNMFGSFVTPRLHLRYQIAFNTIIRASAGQGFRVPNPLAENSGLLVSSRQIRVLEELRPERAWNYGASITQNLTLFGDHASVTANFYRTDFQNQLVVDVDASHTEVRFYNLHGKSYANNFQVEMNFHPVSQLEVVAAVRYTDAKTTINNQLVERPFVNTYKGMLSGSFDTRNNRWQFDLTAQFNGPSRIPSTAMLPVNMQMAERSPAYVFMLGQVTFRIRDLELYVGGENLTNFKQMKPIIGSHDPFGPNFDGSMIWGPIKGRMFYFGLRYSIAR
ncbi:MAG TPA: TonB-dependent receptor [Bacteroidales bacterium]|nr:TonB-dependent receptor [Bacteroidales bacterium]